MALSNPRATSHKTIYLHEYKETIVKNRISNQRGSGIFLVRNCTVLVSAKEQKANAGDRTRTGHFPSTHKKGRPVGRPKILRRFKACLEVVGPLAVAGGIETFALLFFGDAQTHGHVDQLEQHQADDTRPNDGDQHAGGLRHDLTGH